MNRLTRFWFENAKSKLGRLHLLWIISFAMCAVGGLRATDMTVHQRIGFALWGSLLIYAGLIIFYFVPALITEKRKFQKENELPTLRWSIFLGIWIFPIGLFVFLAIVALLGNLGAFDL
jgi:hypothetical protein